MENIPQNQTTEEQSVSLKDLLLMFVQHWRFFAISVCVCGAVAFFLIKSSQKYYTRSASILVKDNKNSTQVADIMSLSDMGFKSSSTIDNDIYLLKSKTLMREVVERLNLQISYSYKPMLREYDLYGTTPVHVKFPDEGLYSNLSLIVVPSDNQHVTLKGFADKKKEIVARFWDTVNTPVGRVVVIPRWSYKDYMGEEIFVQKRNIKNVVSRYVSAMNISKADKLSSVITLSMEDPSADKAEDVINTLIKVYKEAEIEDKSLVMDKSVEFINDRMAELETELSAMESNLASFKRRERLVDLEAYGTDYLKYSDEHMKQRKELENQISMVKYLREYVQNMKDNYDVIPVGVGLSDGQLTTVISEYNSTYLQKEKYMWIFRQFCFKYQNCTSTLKQFSNLP